MPFSFLGIGSMLGKQTPGAGVVGKPGKAKRRAAGRRARGARRRNR